MTLAIPRAALAAALEALQGIDPIAALGALRSGDPQAELVLAEELTEIGLALDPDLAPLLAIELAIGVLVAARNAGLIHIGQPGDSAMDRAAGRTGMGGR